MSGPGWLPSRPRPLGQVRRRLVSYASPYLRRAARRARAVAPVDATRPMPPMPAMPAMASPCGMAQGDAAFASRRGKLPVATLLPPRSEGRPRVMTGALQRWLEHRWLWVQPRMIPLIAAFIGLIAVLNARRYLLELARGPAVACVAPAGVEAAHAGPGVSGHGVRSCPSANAAR